MNINWETLGIRGWHDLAGAAIVLVGALFYWAVLARISQRSKRRFELLLADAENDDIRDWGALQRRLTALRLVINAARYGGALVFALLLLSQFDIRVNSLLLPAGFFGAALGVGAQGVVRDTLSGLFILFEGQFAVGDVVTINGTTGTVEEIGVRVTRLRDDNGQIAYFPNGAITNVARFPTRVVPLFVRVPILRSGRHDEIGIVVQLALEELSAQIDPSAHGFEAASQPLDLVESEPSEADLREDTIGYALWRWDVHPTRAQLWRDTIPSQVAAALRRAGLNEAGSEIEAFRAPVIS